MGRSRRVIGTITMVVAVYLIAIPFALSLFSRTRDAQHLADRYRPVMSAQGVAQFRANLALVNAGGKQLFDTFLPELQAQLELSDSAFNAFVATNDTFSFNAAFVEMRQAMFPAVAQKLGMSGPAFDTYLHTRYPALLKFLDKWDASIYQGARALSLSQIQYMDEFHNADATPYTALPWLFMAPGVALLLGAASGFAGRRVRGDSAVRPAIGTEPAGVAQ
jgi:hypothetical protein